MYSSNNSNVKYIDSVIKYIGFKSIHDTINIYANSLSMIFNDFDSIFLSIYY